MNDSNERALVKREYRLPWIPDNQQWQAFWEALQEENLRNQIMALLAYEGALRSNELLSLEIGDLDEGFNMVTIRAATAKRRQRRIIACPAYLHAMLITYIGQRRKLSEEHDTMPYCV